MAILILMLSFAIDGGATSQQVAFKTIDDCEKAKEKIVSSIKGEDGRNWGRRNFIAVCVKG